LFFNEPSVFKVGAKKKVGMDRKAIPALDLVDNHCHKAVVYLHHSDARVETLSIDGTRVEKILCILVLF
jgi:hypothetical protein